MPSSNLATVPSLIEPAHYLTSDSPNAYFSVLTQHSGSTRKSQRSYPVASMGFVLADCNPSNDTWISQAEFWAPTRRLVHFMRVGLLFIDLDTYKVPALAHLSPDAQLDALLQRCEQTGIPAPSLVVYSGRGLQTKWLLDGPLPSRALPRWSLVQHELCQRLAPLGADANALDISRVLRLVHTVNSRSGEVVRMVRNTDTRLNFDQLADHLLPLTREQIRLKREAWESDQTQHRPAARTRGNLTVIDNPASGNLRPFFGAQLAWDRLADLRTLARIRGWNDGAPDGSRDLAIFVGACFLAQALPNVPRFYDELRLLGREFAPHWSMAAVNASASAVVTRMKMLSAGQKVEYRGLQVDPRYRWRNDTLIQQFGILPLEERQLRTIVSHGEAARRAAEREVARRAAKREATGRLPRDVYESNAEQRRATARILRAQGKPWSEVANAVGYRNAESARKACA